MNYPFSYRHVVLGVAIAVLSALPLVGCAILLPEQVPKEQVPKTPAEFASKVVVNEGSNFDAHVSYGLPMVREPNPGGLMGDTVQYRLFAYKNKKTGDLSYSIQAQVGFDWFFKDDDWRYYNSASSDHGQQAKVKQMGQEADCPDDVNRSCWRMEYVSVPMTEEFIVENASTGFQVRLNSKAGVHSFLSVQSIYIQGLLQVVKPGSQALNGA